MNVDDYANDLQDIALELGVSVIADRIISNPIFRFQSGSLQKIAHHYGKHGLIKHTWEVVRLSRQTAQFFKDEHTINEVVLFLAALYHDYGKCWDYEFDLPSLTFVDAKTNHRRLIHHISRSAIEWEAIARELKVDSSIRDAVTHCILSHHGQRQWGSPVHPFSREAWILHLSDSMSARCNDCDRLDMLKVGDKTK